MKIELAKLSYSDIKDYDYISLPMDAARNIVIRSEKQFNQWKSDFKKHYTLQGFLEIEIINDEAYFYIYENQLLNEASKQFGETLDRFYSNSKYRGD